MFIKIDILIESKYLINSSWKMVERSWKINWTHLSTSKYM